MSKKINGQYTLDAYKELAFRFAIRNQNVQNLVNKIIANRGSKTDDILLLFLQLHQFYLP